MRDVMLDGAAYLALACALVALATAAIMGWRTWRRWQRLALVRDAATSLIDVHLGRLDEAAVLASEHTGRLADHGEQLATSIHELQSDVEHARWLLKRIPSERDRLRYELGELLLPTNDRDHDRERASSDT